MIDTIRSAPRQPGAKMVVRESGRFVGSVSGGCVEADVVERAKQIFAGEDARRVHYGVTDGEAWEVGLSCGGEIDVWVEQADPESLAARCGRSSTRTATGRSTTNTLTGEKRLERGVLEGTGLREDGIFAEVVEGPLRVIDLRRGRGGRAPLLLRPGSRLADDGRRCAAGACDPGAGPERR